MFHSFLFIGPLQLLYRPIEGIGFMLNLFKSKVTSGDLHDLIFHHPGKYQPWFITNRQKVFAL